LATVVADQLTVSKIVDTGSSDQSASKNHKLHLIHSKFTPNVLLSM